MTDHSMSVDKQKWIFENIPKDKQLPVERKKNIVCFVTKES